MQCTDCDCVSSSCAIVVRISVVSCRRFVAVVVQSKVGFRGLAPLAVTLRVSWCKCFGYTQRNAEADIIIVGRAKYHSLTLLCFGVSLTNTRLPEAHRILCSDMQRTRQHNIIRERSSEAIERVHIEIGLTRECERL